MKILILCNATGSKVVAESSRVENGVYIIENKLFSMDAANLKTLGLRLPVGTAGWIHPITKRISEHDYMKVHMLSAAQYECAVQLKAALDAKIEAERLEKIAAQPTVTVRKGDIVLVHRNGAGGFYCYELLEDANVPAPLRDYEKDHRLKQPVKAQALSLNGDKIEGEPCARGFTFDVCESWFVIDRPTFESLWQQCKDHYQLNKLLYKEAEKWNLWRVDSVNRVPLD